MVKDMLHNRDEKSGQDGPGSVTLESIPPDGGIASGQVMGVRSMRYVISLREISPRLTGSPAVRFFADGPGWHAAIAREPIVLASYWPVSAHRAFQAVWRS